MNTRLLALAVLLALTATMPHSMAQSLIPCAATTTALFDEPAEPSSITRLPSVAPDAHGVALAQFEESFGAPPVDSPGPTPVYGEQLEPTPEILPAPPMATHTIPTPPPYPTIATPYPTGGPINGDLLEYGNTTAGCGADCCGGLCGCRPCGHRLWVRGDVLGWWLRGFRVPPLVTTSPVGTAAGVAGVLGQPTTQVTFGDERIGDDMRLGGRIRAGWWLDEGRFWGIEGEFFGLDDEGESFSTTSDGDPILARPFFNTDPAVNAQDAQILALPGLASGSLSIGSSNQVYSGAGLIRGQLSCGCDCDCCGGGPVTRLDLLAGYRYFRLAEDLNALEVLMPQGGPFVPGTAFELRDAIRTASDFHGAEFGLHYQRQSGSWIVEMLPRIALGYVRQRATLDGSTRATIPALFDQTISGGFLVPADRIGTFAQDDFAVIPQAELTIGYLLNPNFRVHVGYNFLYLNNAVRPGDVIDLAIDGRNIATAPPAGLATNPPNLVSDRVYLHGFTLGFTWNF